MASTHADSIQKFPWFAGVVSIISAIFTVLVVLFIIIAIGIGCHDAITPCGPNSFSVEYLVLGILVAFIGSMYGGVMLLLRMNLGLYIASAGVALNLIIIFSSAVLSFGSSFVNVWETAIPFFATLGFVFLPTILGDIYVLRKCVKFIRARGKDARQSRRNQD